MIQGLDSECGRPHLTQQHVLGAAASVVVAVAEALAERVGQVDALAERVAGDGGVLGGDEEAPAEDAEQVRGAAPVPQQPVVTEATRPQPLVLPAARHAVDALDRHVSCNKNVTIKVFRVLVPLLS